jgi:magnesium-transporting ATPase (P-type)
VYSDKTGTLTTNQMSVTRVACVTSEMGGLSEFEVTGTTYSTDGSILDMSARNLLRQPATQPCLWAAAMTRCVWDLAGICERATIQQ